MTQRNTRSIATRGTRIGLALTTALLLGWGASLPAEDNPGITVTGTGTISLPPDVVELGGTISGEAELAADAVVKYEDNKRRIEQRLQALNVDGLKLSWEGMRIGAGIVDQQAIQMAQMRGQPIPSGAGRVSVSDALTVQITGVNKLKSEDLLALLVRLVDASKDGGLNLTPRRSSSGTTLVEFKLADLDAAKEKAYGDAVRDARKSAELLATLSNVKLGGVVFIQETEPRKATAGNVPTYVNPYVQQASDIDPAGSGAFQKIDVTVALNVSFKIAEK